MSATNAEGAPHGVKGFERDSHDFYPEEHWAVELLADAEEWPHEVWDPACGYGTIPQVFALRGHKTIATDLIDRGYGTSGLNFLAYRRKYVRPAEAIVCNPPFKLSTEFLRQAWRFTTVRVAFLLPLKWLASQTRYDLFHSEGLKPARIYVLSNRLSMPPGELIDPVTRRFNCDDPNPKIRPDGSLKYRWRAGDAPGGGGVDFCWVVFEHGYTAETVTGWLSRTGAMARPRGTPRLQPSPEAALGASR